MSAKKRAELVEEGYATIPEIPDGVPLAALPDRQRRAVKAGAVVVEPALAGILAALVTPVAHLDFETIAPAVPAWPGCSPYMAVPVQFSVRLEGRPRGKAEEIGWLADGPEDPRPGLAAALVEALRGAGSIVVYSGYEAGCLRSLARAVPELADDLDAIEQRLVDLLQIVRAHVYHPDFDGSFSVKDVAPALVPGFTYGDLDIGDGGAASSALATLILRGEPAGASERAALRQTLIAYCGRDTLATAGVLERLRGLCGSLTMRS